MGTKDTRFERNDMVEYFGEHLNGLRSRRGLEPQQIWVNPDCGLKTRGWPETREALTHMCDAAKELRVEVASAV